MIILINICGGLAIFLYGMQLCSDGLQKSAAGGLKNILTRLTTNRFMGLLTGIIITILLQSSTATSVMLVGLASASILNLTQTLGVIMGADIGTTVTVQLIAFNIYEYALILVGLGFFRMLTAKKQKTRFLSQAVLGIGLTFFGMKIMTDAIYPLRDSALFRETIVSFAGNPLLALLVATLFTVVINSSAATIGLALSLSTQGLLPLSAAIPVVLGANIGTCSTAILSSLGAPREAKRVAIARLLFKAAGVLVVLPLIKPFEQLVVMTAADVPRQIANAHTLFNVGNALLFLPITNLFAAFVNRLVPEDKGSASLSSPRYIDRYVINTSSVALQLAEKEVLRVGDIAIGMVASINQLVNSGDEELIADTLAKETAIDNLYVEISNYLSDVSQNPLTAAESRQTIALLHVISELEHVGDCVMKIAMMAQKKVIGGLAFSDPGRQELVIYQSEVQGLLASAIKSFAGPDKVLARQVLQDYSQLAAQERDLKESHITRLRSGFSESRSTSSIHLEIINCLRRIADHAAGIAYTIIDQAFAQSWSLIQQTAQETGQMHRLQEQETV
ncbi:MAG TPA: Na/Pi cotransporter family protein [Firmicutes bacterium]|nr:Na/Pi cotransporter family protein [Bacillota bacterium]